jgi:methyltransferase (TIGR00027 family)
MRAGETSTTARHVAAQRLSFPRVRFGGGRPADDERLQAAVADGLDATETAMTRYLRARTAFFDRTVVAALERGIDQLVAVGAGYDGRSLRYAAPGVRWLELDHPTTQADKLARLDTLGIRRDDIAFVPADFVTEDVTAALAGAGHDDNRPTLFLCEGVAGYLPPEAVSGLLRSLRARAAGGSELAVSLSLTPETDAERETKAALAQAVAGMGEPLASTIPRTELGEYLGGLGWQVVSATDPAGVPIADSTRTSALVVASSF